MKITKAAAAALCLLTAVNMAGCANYTDNENTYEQNTTVSAASSSENETEESSSAEKMSESVEETTAVTTAPNDADTTAAPTETTSASEDTAPDTVPAETQTTELPTEASSETTSSQTTTETTEFLIEIWETEAPQTTAPPETTVPESTGTTITTNAAISAVMNMISKPPETEPPAVTETSAATTAETLPETTAEAAPKKVRYVTYAEYFENSLFIGDSICSGLKIYNGLLNVESVAARGNVSTWSLNNYTFQYKTGSTAELDAYSIVQLYQPEDVYIWMGMNDIYVVSEEKFTQNLGEIADKVHELSPDSKVHVVSITPITAGHKWNTGSDGSSRVVRYNAAAKAMCDERDDLDWINVHDALTDANGYLASANNGGDGLHLSAEAYRNVLNEIIAYKSAGN